MNQSGENQAGAFVTRLLSILEEKGFPDNKVAFPLEQMYESAHNKGLNFNKILEYLREKKGIDHELTTEKVIFSACAPEQEKPPVADKGPMGFDFSALDPSILETLKGLSKGDLWQKAQEFMKNLSPEQIAQLQKSMTNLSPEERAKIMQQAREMGFMDPNESK